VAGITVLLVAAAAIVAMFFVVFVVFHGIIIPVVTPVPVFPWSDVIRCVLVACAVVDAVVRT
jgi:hypothetical protein